MRTTAALLALAVLSPIAAQQRETAVAEGVALFQIKSELLTMFWGRDIMMEAGLVLPPDHDPEKKWAVCYNIHGFGGDHRVAWMHRRSLQSQMQDNDYPRLLYVYLNASCPLGHHEFADSANNGPWGEALVTEFIPALEARFGGDGTPAGRFLTGHSSGGWSSLWLQVTYPDFFGGTWSTAPDSVDFRDFTGIDVYGDQNAYFDANGVERPLMRRGGKWATTFRQFTIVEARTREYGGQIASFDAVFSPRGDDGRPMRMFDRETGEIDPDVAKAWQRYDISLILVRNWPRLGPRLAGKIRVYCGLEDTFRLEGAVKLLQHELEELGSDAEVILLPGRDHGSLYAAHPEHWPNGMMDRIHREMWQQYSATRRP